MRFIFTLPLAVLLSNVTGAAAPLPAAPIPACLRDLCPFEGATLTRPRPADHARKIEVDLTNRILPLLNQNLDRAVAATGNARLRALFTELPLPAITLDEDLRVVVNAIYVTEAAAVAEDASAIDFDGASGTYRVNADRALKALHQSPRFAGTDDSLARAIEAMVNAPSYRLMEARENIPLSWLYAQNEKNMNYREFIRALFAETRAAEARVTGVLPLLTPPRSDLTRRFEAGEAISDRDSAAMISEYVRSAVLAEALSPAPLRARLLEVKRDFVADARRVWTRDQERTPSAAWTVTGLREYCLAKYTGLVESFPLVAEIRRYDRVERIPTQATAVSLLREKGLTEGATRLVTAGVHYPADYATAMDNLVAQIKVDQTFGADQARRQDEMIADARAGQGRAQARVLAMFAADAVGDANELNDLGQACTVIEPPPLRDATFDTEISVSWQLILRAHSDRTLAHEMGHAAFFAYPADQRPAVMTEQIACLMRRHCGLEARPEHYVEEDYADLVADQVIRRRGDRRSAPLCEYVTSEVATVAQAPENNDTHSSTLFRLIASAADQVPRQCEAVVRAAGATNVFERCW